MSKPVLSMGPAAGPFSASLTVAAGALVRWALYTYARDPSGTWALSGAHSTGEGPTPGAVPSLRAGDVLCWTVKAVDPAALPRSADVQASLLVDGQPVSTTEPSQVTVSPDEPVFYFYVGVRP